MVPQHKMLPGETGSVPEDYESVSGTVAAGMSLRLLPMVPPPKCSRTRRRSRVKYVME